MALENTPSTHQSIENQEGVIYDVELQNALSNMKNNTRLFNIEERDYGDIFRNGFPNEKAGGIKLKTNEKIYDITPGNQKILTDTSNMPMKQLNIKIEKYLIIFQKIMILRFINQYVVN